MGHICGWFSSPQCVAALLVRQPPGFGRTPGGAPNPNLFLLNGSGRQQRQ